MKQFGKILKFELKNYLYNKIFIGVTLFLVLIIAVVMFFPRITSLFTDGDLSDETVPSEDLPVMMIVNCDAEYANMIRDSFSAAFPEYRVVISEEMLQDVKNEIVEERVACAFVLDSLTSYTYYVNNLSMYA